MEKTTDIEPKKTRTIILKLDGVNKEEIKSFLNSLEGSEGYVSSGIYLTEHLQIGFPPELHGVAITLLDVAKDIFVGIITYKIIQFLENHKEVKFKSQNEELEISYKDNEAEISVKLKKIINETVL